MLHVLKPQISKKALFVVAGVVVALASASGFAFAAQSGALGSALGSTNPPIHTVQGPAGHHVTKPGISTISPPSAAELQQLQAAQNATEAQGTRGTPPGPISHDGAGPTGNPVQINRTAQFGLTH